MFNINANEQCSRKHALSKEKLEKGQESQTARMAFLYRSKILTHVLGQEV